MDKIDFNENCPDCHNKEVCPGLLQAIINSRANLYEAIWNGGDGTGHLKNLQSNLNNFDVIRIHGKCMK